MSPDTENVLRKIGDDLNNDIYPVAVGGGIVMPSSVATPTPLMGQEKDNEYQRETRPSTRSWQRSQGWQRATSRARPSNNASSLVSTVFKEEYKSEIEDVCRNYPGTKYWIQDEGLWLLFESTLIPGYMGKVVFAVAIPFILGTNARGWAFWSGITWIGPRHTNFPDGSICAYDPGDSTWSVGDPMINLLDIYVLWAVRHLYLSYFNKWPGRQSVHSAYERIVELKDDEFCGCETNQTKLYRDCCKTMDMSINKVAAAVNFVLMYGSERMPPDYIVDFVCDHMLPPKVTVIF